MEFVPGTMSVQIRPECEADLPGMDEVILQAFFDHPHSQQTEHRVVRALREAGLLTVSLVAESAGQIVGQIAFSPVTISDGATDWYILGPVSVHPTCQGQGIGRRLIEHGLARLRERQAAGCVLVGDPRLYYRFGFTHSSRLILPEIPAEYFLTQTFGPPAHGEVTIPAAFHTEE